MTIDEPAGQGREIERGYHPEESSDGLEREAYLEERKMLIEGEGEASQSFDKTLVTLSAGAFGLSLAFIVQVAPRPVTMWALYLAWGGLVLSLLSVLLSFLMSQYGFRRAQEILDSRYKGGIEESNVWNTATGILNVFSIVSFIVGVVSLAYFAVRNVA